MDTCHCGAAGTYETHCEPYVTGAQEAPTAEAQMRARYSAFVVGSVDYILDTHHSSTVHEVNREDIASWSNDSEWRGLEIHDTDEGQPGDEHGVVVFTAHYDLNGTHHDHFERSEFMFENGRWFFLTANAPAVETIRREDPKVGRNDPCPCGSGAKYKRCCGKAA